MVEEYIPLNNKCWGMLRTEVGIKLMISKLRVEESVVSVLYRPVCQIDTTVVVNVFGHITLLFRVVFSETTQLNILLQ